MTVQASDTVGNQTSANVSFVVADSAAPVVTVSVPATDNATFSQVPFSEFEFTFDDADAQITCTLDGAPYFDCDGYGGDGYADFYDIQNGAHTLLVTATDQSGNASTAARHFTVDDHTPPDL